MILISRPSEGFARRFLTCCLFPLRVSMTNCMVSEMSESPSPMHCWPEPPFFSWLFSCSGMATSSWCTFTASPLRCCRDQKQEVESQQAGRVTTSHRKDRRREDLQVLQHHLIQSLDEVFVLSAGDVLQSSAADRHFLATRNPIQHKDHPP